VIFELRNGVGNHILQAVLNGEVDAAIAADPIPDAPFEKVPVYNEELVLISAAGHRPLNSARDVEAPAILVFEQGCPWRMRLDAWFGRTGDLPQRKIEITSYHAMLGCAVVGMGISLVPRMVLDALPERDKLRVHPLPPDLRYAQTFAIWRKGARSPKLDALVEIVTEHAAAINARQAPSSAARPRKQAAAVVATARRSRKLRSR
jgi:DNA-binding transcriptional LysR family regulator